MNLQQAQVSESGWEIYDLSPELQLSNFASLRVYFCVYIILYLFLCLCLSLYQHQALYIYISVYISKSFLPMM